jgi:uncharacterized integral membrane protein
MSFFSDILYVGLIILILILIIIKQNNTVEVFNNKNMYNSFIF